MCLMTCTFYKKPGHITNLNKPMPISSRQTNVRLPIYQCPTAYLLTCVLMPFVLSPPQKSGDEKAEESGQFVMILQYDLEKKTEKRADVAVGCTIKMNQPWSQVKPNRGEYEREIEKMLRTLLGDCSPTSERLEMVG